MVRRATVCQVAVWPAAPCPRVFSQRTSGLGGFEAERISYEQYLRSIEVWGRFWERGTSLENYRTLDFRGAVSNLIQLSFEHSFQKGREEVSKLYFLFKSEIFEPS